MGGTEWFCGVQLGGVKLPAEFLAARNSKSMVHAGTGRWRQKNGRPMLIVGSRPAVYRMAVLCIHSLIQKGRRLNLPTDIMLKLFDSCVEPILLYGCEVWGYENVDILEKVHTKFCKFIFGVSKYSHNMPVYGELGRYPLSIKIKQRMVRYWTRILKSSEYKLNKVMYTSLYNLHCKNVHLSPWIRYVSSIFQNSGSNYVWLTQDCNIDAKIIFKSECDQFMQLWHSR